MAATSANPEHPLVVLAERESSHDMALAKRIAIPTNSTSDPGLIAATSSLDPWVNAGNYALGWVYFCLILLVATMTIRFYHLWTDKIRAAMYEEEAEISSASSPDCDYEMKALETNNTAAKLFPRSRPPQPKTQSSVSSFAPLNNTIALVRYLFYRPVPTVTWRRRTISFPSLGVIFIMSAALIFVSLYCFLPKPLYYSTMAYGSPPLAIRAGMLAVAMVPWIIAMSMKANLVTLLTGIGHERLNVLHRWGGYLCLFLSLVHALPLYVQPMWDQGGWQTFQGYLSLNNGQSYIYATGIGALTPLIWLCVASLPVVRKWMYELFVALHMPVAVLYLGMLFWHCNNYLTSWSYLYATVAIWVTSYVARLFLLNWTNPWRMSWLVGDECAITLMSEDAIKVTVPTEVKWRPGQYVYLRMPGISVFENHPFTISSLWSDDFPSEYGENYRDMTLVFKPFGGFTRKVLNTALAKGPAKTYRAFVDGPYGGMQRRLEAFDNVVLIAGGSGITAIVSQLLTLVKKMRDGKAVTKSIQVVWAIKRLESMEWFREELRICRENAPPDSVHCQFFVTAAKRHGAASSGRGQRPISGIFGSEKINDFAQGIASKRNSALIHDEAAGDLEKELELRRENEDNITALPPRRLAPPEPAHVGGHRRQRPSLEIKTELGTEANAGGNAGGFDFGFPSTPTVFQKNLMRFAFGVSGVKRKEGWSTEYGRPDIPYMLREASREFGRRSCVFVCGPPSMRIDVANTVAELQREVWMDSSKDEICLHAENYAI